MEYPHLKLVFVALAHGVRGFAGAGQAWAFFQRFDEFARIVSWHLHHFLDLALAQVFTLPDVGTAVDVIATGRIWEQVPWVDTLRCRLNLAHFNPLDDAVRPFGCHLGAAQDGIWAFQHTRPDAGGILDQLAHLTMPVRFDQSVFNGLLHPFGGGFGNLGGPGNDLLGVFFTPKHHHVGLAEFRQRGRTDCPCAIIGRQQHVRDAGAGRIGVRPGDVQEYRGSLRTFAVRLVRSPALGLHQV